MENKDFFDNDREQTLPPEDEMKQIQKSIRNRNRKTVFVSIVLTASMLLVCVFGIIPAVEQLYWNPSETTYGSHTDLETMLHVYTELVTPGYNTFHVNYRRSGFARYDLEVPVFSTAQNKQISATGVLSKNILSLDQNYFHPMEKNYPFPRLTSPEYSPNSYDLNQLRQRLGQLPEYIRLEATICFPQDLSMEELMAFRSEHSDLLITWVAVRSTDPSELLPPLLGMDPFTGGTVFDGFLMEYRYFDASQITEADHLEKHFKRRLQYYIDQVEKEQAFYRYNAETLKENLAYVEEQGVYTYGCVVTASPKVLLDLLDSGIVCDVHLVDCWIDIG